VFQREIEKIQKMDEVCKGWLYFMLVDNDLNDFEKRLKP
jgi:hypothetical protein